MKNIKNKKAFLNENKEIMSIIDLSNMVARLGFDSTSKEHLLNMLQYEFKLYGDEGIVKIFKEMTGGIEIEPLSRGKYIFK